MNKIVASPQEAVADISDGSTVAIAGFSVGHRFATSLICAPIKHDTHVYGLIHLYGSSAVRGLDAEDLEFALAVANQLALAVESVRKQDRLSAENRSLRDQLRVESELVGESQAVPSM